MMQLNTIIRCLVPVILNCVFPRWNLFPQPKIFVMIPIFLLIDLVCILFSFILTVNRRRLHSLSHVHKLPIHVLLYRVGFNRMFWIWLLWLLVILGFWSIPLPLNILVGSSLTLPGPLRYHCLILIMHIKSLGLVALIFEHHLAVALFIIMSRSIDLAI